MDDMSIVIYSAAFVLGNVFLSFAIFTYISHLLRDKKRSPEEYKLLKNALFSMALTMVYSDNIDRDNYNYDKYNGSTLPPLSGCDIINAYASYMTDSENPHIHAKFNAIQRFIHSNLTSESEQEAFLQNFIIKLNSIIDESDESEETKEEAQEDLKED